MGPIKPTATYHLNYERLLDLRYYYHNINKFYRRIMEFDLILSQCKAESWQFESSQGKYLFFCKEYLEKNERNCSRRESFIAVLYILILGLYMSV